MPGLPDASIFPFSPVGTRTALSAPAEAAKPPAPALDRGAMFEKMVSSDGDLVGMVGYAFYKQNKRDFMAAFREMHGRAPDEAEIRAYMMGEGTARRLSTYRHLAENFLAAQDKGGLVRGSAGEVTAPTKTAPRPRNLADLLRQRAAPRKGGPGWLTAAYIAFLILLLVAIAVFIRTGFAPGR